MRLFDIWLCMKFSWLSDEVHTLLAKSEVANSISWLCEGCNSAFNQAKGTQKSNQFMESKLHESDVRLSNISKTEDDNNNNNGYF